MCDVQTALNRMSSLRAQLHLRCQADNNGQDVLTNGLAPIPQREQLRSVPLLRPPTSLEETALRQVMVLARSKA